MKQSIEQFPAWGIWCPSVTPLFSDLSINHSVFVQHVHELLNTGCHGVVVFGTTGEAVSFSVKERCEGLKKLLEQKVSREKIMVGAGCSSLSDTVQLVEYAVVNHCFNILLIPPFFYKKVSDDGVYQYYAQIIERLHEPRLRLFLYHFPNLSGVPISLELVERLRQSFGEIIAGVKDSSGDWSNTQTLLQHFPDMAIFPGSERYLLSALRSGGAGCISATANANAAAIRQTFEAWYREVEEVEQLQTDILGIRKVFEAYTLVAALKSYLGSQTGDNGWLNIRPPLVGLSQSEQRSLFRALEEFD